MKAVVLRELGGLDKLLYEDVPIPQAEEDEVVIKLKYAALNRRDVFIRKGLYHGIKLPAIMGADGAGVVTEVGNGVNGIKEGMEVVIYPGFEWGDNPRFAMKKFHILGVPTDGTHAQYVKVPARNVFPKPKYLTWEEAASLPLAGLTAYRALFTRGNIQPGEVLVIPGIGGGVATFVLQMAVAVGAKVYVTSGDDEKINKAISLGAIDGINYHNNKWDKELRALIGDGADICIDTIGGDTFNKLVSLAKLGARIVTFGATSGPVNNLLMPKIFLKQLDILGTTMGTEEEFGKMLQFFEKYEIRPAIAATFPLENIRSAHHYMENGNQFGKIVLEIPQ